MEKVEIKEPWKIRYVLFHTFLVIYLHCFFHPTKLEYLFVSIFGCQTVHPKIKLLTFWAILNYGKFLHFFIMWFGCISQSTKFEFLFLSRFGYELYLAMGNF